MAVNAISIHGNGEHLYFFINAMTVFRMKWVLGQKSCLLLFYLAKLFPCQVPAHFSRVFQ